MRSAGPADLLLERDRKLESLRAVLQDAAGGGGRLALVEGPAGIGKSRLLAELRRAAQEDDMRVLTARGSELEREFPFGVVRQLFEPQLTNGEERERWLAGAAAPARAIFEAADSSSNGMRADATVAALHGLYWLTASRSHEAAAPLQPLAPGRRGAHARGGHGQALTPKNRRTCAAARSGFGGRAAPPRAGA